MQTAGGCYCCNLDVHNVGALARYAVAGCNHRGEAEDVAQLTKERRVCATRKQ